MMASALRFLLYAGMLISCSDIPTTLHTDVRSITLDDVGLAINMPGSFKGYTAIEEIFLWENSSEPKEVVERRIAYLKMLVAESGHSRYFVDTTNNLNDIRIREVPFMKIGKFLSREGFLVVDAKLQEQGVALGIKYEVLENTYFTLANGNDVMQIRYKATQKYTHNAGFVDVFGENERSFFTTFYVVTGPRTAMISVNHESEDFEYFVRSIRFLE
jgi:hypothetical protein